MVRILEYRGMLDEKNRAQLEDMYPNVQPTADFSNLNDLPSSRFWCKHESPVVIAIARDLHLSRPLSDDHR